jgi:hypothetical protein
MTRPFLAPGPRHPTSHRACRVCRVCRVCRLVTRRPGQAAQYPPYGVKQMSPRLRDICYSYQCGGARLIPDPVLRAGLPRRPSTRSALRRRELSGPLQVKPNSICWMSAGNGRLLFEVVATDTGRLQFRNGGSLRRDQVLSKSGFTERNLPGRTLLEIAELAISSDARDRLIQQRAGEPPWELHLAMTERVLAPAERGVHIIAGLESPPHAGARYIRFEPGVIRQWVFDLIAARALPMQNSGVAYEAIKIFTPDEWAHVEQCAGFLRPMVPLPERRPGRPNARNTSIELFNRRRSEGIPIARIQLAEATAILGVWPAAGPRKPAPATVSEHISDLYGKATGHVPDKR